MWQGLLVVAALAGAPDAAVQEVGEALEGLSVVDAQPGVVHVRVYSGGCTTAKDFRVDVEEKRGASLVRITRLKGDYCKALTSGLEVRLAAPGINTARPTLVANPLGRGADYRFTSELVLNPSKGARLERATVVANEVLSAPGALSLPWVTPVRFVHTRRFDVRVESRGCTTGEDFVVRLRETLGATYAQLVRVRPDSCKQTMPDGVVVTLPGSEAVKLNSARAPVYFEHPLFVRVTTGQDRDHFHRNHQGPGDHPPPELS